MTTPTIPGSAATVVDVTALPPAIALLAENGDGQGLLYSRPCLLVGWSLAETSGTAATSVVIYDGRDTGGQRVAHFAAPANGSQAVALPPPGILVRAGLYVEPGGGAFAGAIWIIPL